MLGQETSNGSARTTTLTVVAWLLVAVALLSATGCCPVVVQPQPLRPDPELLEPAKTQYLLPPDLQRTAPKPRSS